MVFASGLWASHLQAYLKKNIQITVGYFDALLDVLKVVGREEQSGKRRVEAVGRQTLVGRTQHMEIGQETGVGTAEDPFRVVFISGMFVDLKETGRVLFVRVKTAKGSGGRPEVTVMRLGFFPSKAYPQDALNQCSSKLRVPDKFFFKPLLFWPASMISVEQLGQISLEAARDNLIQNVHGDLGADAAYDFYGVRLVNYSLGHRIQIWQPDESGASGSLRGLCVADCDRSEPHWDWDSHRRVCFRARGAAVARGRIFLTSSSLQVYHYKVWEETLAENPDDIMPVAKGVYIDVVPQHHIGDIQPSIQQRFKCKGAVGREDFARDFAY
ncbi:hypothetical protein EDB87DRAFT_1824485 [Lactarius vividus]|nr:hypothetical protein EDB87DRAFT_1824485 [Lactarius vividus]